VKLPLLSGRRVYAALERLGFIEVHRKGSHVPFHNEVDRYTLRGALRDAGISEEEFIARLR
jgi:predicted RNA binding protein YcfA (HicA-like mRNA interferase family)